jgi:DNA-binding response OmpR family regulator
MLTQEKTGPDELKVLVIDDDELTRIMICNTLKKAGLTSIEAANGTDGLSLYKSKRPCLVITDILMPYKEGLETIAHIRSLSAEAKIIAMSSGGKTQNMSFLKLSLKLGANRILSKPFKPGELLKVVGGLLKSR